MLVAIESLVTVAALEGKTANEGERKGAFVPILACKPLTPQCRYGP
jgi:hypothetical protein